MRLLTGMARFDLYRLPVGLQLVVDFNQTTLLRKSEPTSSRR